MRTKASRLQIDPQNYHRLQYHHERTLLIFEDRYYRRRKFKKHLQTIHMIYERESHLKLLLTTFPLGLYGAVRLIRILDPNTYASLDIILLAQYATHIF